MIHVTLRSGKIVEVQPHGAVGVQQDIGYGSADYIVVSVPDARIMHWCGNLTQARLLATTINHIGLARWFPAVRIWRVSYRGYRRAHRRAHRRLSPLWRWQEYSYNRETQDWLTRQNCRLIDWLLGQAAAHDGDYCYDCVAWALIDSETWPERIARVYIHLRASAQDCRDDAATTGTCYCGRYGEIG
jgi:hypothetical protein